MFRVVAKCQACQAEQHIMNVVEVGPDARMYAETYAGIVDGSSSLFVYSPRAEDSRSTIGKCGLCGGQIDCQVEDV